jgi:uncharacterized integral membrane protein
MSPPAQERSSIAAWSAANWLAIFLAITAIAFIFQNRDTVSIDVFFVSVRLPLWISLSLVFLAGWLSGRFWRRT